MRMPEQRDLRLRLLCIVRQLRQIQLYAVFVAVNCENAHVFKRQPQLARRVAKPVAVARDEINRRLQILFQPFYVTLTIAKMDDRVEIFIFRKLCKHLEPHGAAV